MYFIPYSDHSPYEELFTFISHLKPTELYPIVYETKLVSDSQRMKLSSIIPKSLYDLCCKRKKITNGQNKELVLPCDKDKPKTPTSQMSSEVRCTSSAGRPEIMQNKKLSKASKKKGVQFDSSDTSDDDTSKTDEADMRQLEREEIIIRTSSDNYVRVKIPHNMKNNLLDVQVKLFDISNLWKGLIDISSQLNTKRKTLRNLTGMYSEGGLSEGRVGADDYELSTYGSDGRTNPMNTTSEELGSCPSTHHESVGNTLQEISLPYAMYIKDITVKLQNPDDTDHISVCSVSTVMAPDKHELQGNEDSADVQQDCEVRNLRDSFSVKEEDIHECDIYLDGENGLLRTEDTTKNVIVMFPSDSDTEDTLWGRSESNTAPDERKSPFQSNRRGSLHRRWNKSTRRQRLEHPHSSQKTITEQLPRLRKRNRANTELNRTNKRKKYYSKDNSMSTDIHNLPHLWCTNYTNDMDASQAHGRKDEKTLKKGCKRNFDKACHDRISMSVQSAQISNYLGEPDMQLSDNESLSEVSCAPKLLRCSNDNKNQVYSGSHTPYKKKKKANTICGKKNRVKTVSKARDGDVESRRTSHTAACPRDITLNKETRIASEVPHQAVITPGLTEKGEDIVPCDTTCNRMEVVRGAQSSELSFYSCTASEEQSEVASTKSKRISNLEGAENSVTGGIIDVICLPENNQIISPPEQSKSVLPFLSADEQEFHGKYAEKNSRMLQTIQHFIQCPLSSDSHNMSQMDPQKHDVGIQCELLTDRGLSGVCHRRVCCAPIEIHVINDSANIPSENPVEITNLSQEVVVLATESVAMINSRHSAEQKQSSPEGMSELHKPWNDPNLGNEKCSTVTMHDTHVDKSHGLGKVSDPNNSTPKNKATFLRDAILQDNIYNGTDTTVQGTDQSAANAHKSSKNDSNNKQDVRKTLHSVRDSNRTVTTDNELSQYPESLKCKPSTNGMDHNYWTNGNRTPFAIAEVFLAAKELSSQKGNTHKISESSRNMNDEDGNQQQIHKAKPVFNLKYSTQQEKQFMALTEHHLTAEKRKVNCFNDTEEVHTISGKARPVNASCVVEGKSGRLSSQDILSNLSRGNDAQVEDSNVNSGHATPMHLYTAGEPLTVSSPCSFVSNTSTTYEETVSDYENVFKTSEGTTDMLGENRITPETSERSDLQSGITVILETSEESVDLLRDWGTESDTMEISDDLLGVNIVSPETLQRTDDQLETGVVAETPGLDLLDKNDPDIVPDTAGEYMTTVQTCSCLKNKGVSGNSLDSAEGKCKELVQIKSSSVMVKRKGESSLKLCNSRKVDALGNNKHNIRKPVLGENQCCKTVSSVNIIPTQYIYGYTSPTTLIKGPHATWCQMYLHRRGMSANQSTNIRNFINITPMFNKFCSASAVLAGLDICKNPDGVLFYFNKNEINKSRFLKFVDKLRTALSQDSFSVKGASRGKEGEQIFLSIRSEMSSDDLFPSNQVMLVTKTYGRANHSQNASRSLNQNPQNLYALQEYTRSETDLRQWKSSNL
jgi:hypothetical protein